MKASEIYATWLCYGVSDDILRRELLVAKLHDGDYETNTTPELMAISEAAERENLPSSPPDTCASCKHEEHCERDWTYGHRPDWWVCSQCKTVWACRCSDAEEDGTCTHCGRTMSAEDISAYCDKEAKELARSESLVDRSAGGYTSEMEASLEHLWQMM